MHSGSHHPCKSFHHSQTGLVLTLELKKRKNLESRFRVVITRRRIYGQMVAFQWVQQASNAMTSLSKGQIWCLFHLIGHLPALLLKLTICLQKNVKPKTSLVTQWYKITKKNLIFSKIWIFYLFPILTKSSDCIMRKSELFIIIEKTPSNHFFTIQVERKGTEFLMNHAGN